MTDSGYKVVVVGGGPAGLAAAWRLRDSDVLLLEQADRLGGRLRSLPRGEYWLNLGGHLFPGPGSHVHQLISALGLDVMEIPGIKTAVWFKGKMHASRHVETYPFTLPLALRDRVALSLTGLKVIRHVRAWYSVSRPREGESDLERCVRMSHFEAGRSFAELLGRLPDDVDAIFRSAGRRAAAELEEQSAAVGLSLFGALWVGSKSQSQLNVKGGSGLVGEAVKARLGDAVVLGAHVRSVRPTAAGVEITYRTDTETISVTARHVVVGTPADVARSIIEDLPSEVDEALASVNYGPFVCMGVITAESGPMPWDGIYAITTPGLAFDMLFNHANPVRTAEGRRPGGSLMCYAGGQRARDLLSVSEAEIERTFRSDLQRVYPQLAHFISEAVVQKWTVGIFFRTPATKTEALLRYSSAPGNVVHLAGDYFADHGGTIEAATASGFEAAAAVLRALRQHRPK